MKKILFSLTLLISGISYSQKPTISGGNMEVTQIGANQFIMSATVQLDSFNVTIMNVNAFDNNMDTFVTSFSISLDSSATIPIKYNGITIDTNYVNYLSDTFTISNNPNGYYFVNNEFYRIKETINMLNGDYLFTCQIPNPAVSGGNSNPKFVNFHDSLFAPIAENIILNFNCYDLDNDSLYFSISEPLDSVFISGGKPYRLLNWRAANNLANALGPAGRVIVSYDSIGSISVFAPQIGVFYLPVKCEEFRNGIKIGEVTRDIPLIARNPPLSLKSNKALGNISIFPNPSNGNFTISIEDFKELNLDILIINVSGKIVYSEQLNSSETNINLEHLPMGIYFMKLTDGENQTVKRIVIQ